MNIPAQPSLPGLKSQSEIDREKFELQIAHFPPAKRELFRLLRFYEFDQPYTFECFGNKTDANRFIGNIRTNLSRLRAEAEAKGVVLQQFTIKVMGMETKSHLATAAGVTKTTTITLKKVKSGKQEMSEGFQMIFKDLVAEI